MGLIFHTWHLHTRTFVRIYSGRTEIISFMEYVNTFSECYFKILITRAATKSTSQIHFVIDGQVSLSNYLYILEYVFAIGALMTGINEQVLSTKGTDQLKIFVLITYSDLWCSSLDIRGFVFTRWEWSANVLSSSGNGLRRVDCRPSRDFVNQYLKNYLQKNFAKIIILQRLCGIRRGGRGKDTDTCTRTCLLRLWPIGNQFKVLHVKHENICTRFTPVISLRYVIMVFQIPQSQFQIRRDNLGRCKIGEHQLRWTGCVACHGVKLRTRKVFGKLDLILVVSDKDSKFIVSGVSPFRSRRISWVI